MPPLVGCPAAVLIHTKGWLYTPCRITVAFLTFPFSGAADTLQLNAVAFLPHAMDDRMVRREDVLKKQDILRAWGRILVGKAPSMSIEITRRCPLSCPGCYAYQNSHLAREGSLTNAREFEGEQLIRGVLSLVDRHRPLHLSIVGGEPLVRQREITALLPELERRKIHTQIVTSAVSPIPIEWSHFRHLTLVVSVDGLPSEHDRRRAPATYNRILNHMRGHLITVHCTITRQMTQRPGYLREFLDFWSERDEVRKIWMSLYTPQIGESRPELIPQDLRKRVIDELTILNDEFAKLELPPGLLQAYRTPPAGPRHCVFALTTQTISSDLTTRVIPCQLGGRPDCHQCGCIAAAGMLAISRHRLPGGIQAGTIFTLSHAFGLQLRKWLDNTALSRPIMEGNPIPRIGQNAEIRIDGA